MFLSLLGARRLALAAAIVVLAACRSGPAATPEASPTPRPPEVAVTSPATKVPTATPLGSDLSPSATPASGSTPTNAPAAVAVGPQNFPAGVNPLTGLQVANPNLLNRRPLAIKVANSPRSIRDKQTGLGVADLVFEHIAEGGNTRMTALYLGQDAPQVGPMRSARLIDLELPAMYKAVFAFSGASAGTREKILFSDVVGQMFSENSGGCPPLCRVDPENWNLLMADTAALSQLATDRGIPNGAQNLDGLKFDPTPPFGGEPARTVTVRYSNETWADWRYDPNTGRYLRWSDVSPTELKPQLDALTNQPISAANVAVLFAPTYTTDILEDDQGLDPATGQGGHYGVQIQLWNVGSAVIFRDGLAYRATWVRLSRDGALGFVDAANQPIALKPGNSWVQLLGARSENSSSAGTWTFTHQEP